VSTMNRYDYSQQIFLGKLANHKCMRISASNSGAPALPAVPLLPSSTIEKSQRALFKVS